MAFGYYSDRHVDDERKLNLRAIIDKAAKDPEKMKDIRGQLAPTSARHDRRATTTCITPRPARRF